MDMFASKSPSKSLMTSYIHDKSDFSPFARNKSDQTLLHMVALQVTRVLWCPLIKIGKVFKSMCNNAIFFCIFYIEIVVRPFSTIYPSQRHNLPPTFHVRYFWNYNSKISKSSKKKSDYITENIIWQVKWLIIWQIAIGNNSGAWARGAEIANSSSRNRDPL